MNEPVTKADLDDQEQRARIALLTAATKLCQKISSLVVTAEKCILESEAEENDGRKD